MAHAITNLAATGGVSEKVARMAAAWNVRVQKRRLNRRTYRELSELTNSEMADLGLNRTMIAAVAYEAAYGKN